MVCARSRGDPVACPVCGVVTGKVHGYYQRRLADAPAGRARVVLELRLRRLVCVNLDCRRQTFHEQVPGLAERYARRTPPLASWSASSGRAGGPDGVGAAGGLWGGVVGHRGAGGVDGAARTAPAGAGGDRGGRLRVEALRRYATVIIDALTHQRLEVLDGRLAVTLEAWLNAHPSVRLVCWDRSTAYAAGTREGAPQAVQVADRWQCAMRRLVVSPVEPGGTGGRFLGSMAYLDPKGEGDSSMPLKRRSCSGVGGGASWDPRDMAKAGLLESQFPVDGRSHPSEINVRSRRRHSARV